MSDDKSKKTEVPAQAPAMADTIEDKIARMVAAAVKEAIPLAVAAAAQIAAASVQQVQMNTGHKAEINNSRCPECKQLERACGGKHRKLVVFPRNEEYGEWFPGVKLNGILYRSSGPGHLITVPENTNIEEIVNLWEQGEKTLRYGRKRNHNSGSIGPQHNHFVPAQNAGW